MSIKDRIEDGFGRVNSAVFRRVNDRTEWWHLPVPLGLLNLRALRDDLREFIPTGRVRPKAGPTGCGADSCRGR